MLLRSGCALENGTYTAGIRPEAFEIGGDGIPAEAEHVRMTGQDLLIYFTFGKVQLRALVHSELQIEKESKFHVKVRENQLLVFDKNTTAIGKY